jgi:hypothetical protein
MIDIFRIQPFATDKNQFGKALNDHCAAAPAGSWIQFMDWDAHILTIEAFSLMEKAIEMYPDTDVFGAMTNRIGVQDQRSEIYLWDNWNYKEHVAKAQLSSMLFKDGECIDIFYVGGFFMLFKKSYWEKNNFQPAVLDNMGKSFDKTFSINGKCRVIKGLYIFHQYRMHNKTWKTTHHLK